MPRTVSNLQRNRWELDATNPGAVICRGEPIATFVHEEHAKRIVWLHNTQLEKEVQRDLDAWDTDYK